MTSHNILCISLLLKKCYDLEIKKVFISLTPLPTFFLIRMTLYMNAPFHIYEHFIIASNSDLFFLDQPKTQN